MNKKIDLVKWRVYFVLTGIIIFSFILILRLYFLQIVNGERYLERANNQSFTASSDMFERGNIYFSLRNGTNVAAASVKTGYKLALNPSIIENPESVYNNISMYAEIEHDEFLTRISNKNLKHVELIKRIDKEISDDIRKKGLTGVNLYPEKWRFYPGNELASHVLGFVSYNNDKRMGQYGLERKYEEILNREGEGLFKNFFVEIFSNIKDVVIDNKDMKGSIVTTIEPRVQAFLENEFVILQEKYNFESAGGIIMNPQNGEIYSMSIYPNFDLNNFNLVEDSNIYQNHLVESLYEFGSIMKPITIAIGLDQNKITPESTYDDKGSKTLNGRTFYNHDLKTHGIVNMQTVLNDSLNIGVSEIVDRVGNAVFADYMKKIFSGITDVDLPNEQWPLVSNLDSKNDIEYATASFGQGIAVTPISMIRGLATLANGGYLVQPHLVKKIEYRSGFSKDIEYKKLDQIFSNQTSETISRMLVNTVDEALLNGKYSIPNFTVGAKTGTAQIAKSGESGYYDDRYLHSFFGYFPAYDPKFIILLYITEPKGVNYASQSLTEPFMNLTNFLISYYELLPDRFVEDNN